ncbi:hypothetical protein ACN6LA_007662, partial [Streptomyces sp. SAS_269]|uniref:hypothetical protein n=1 Tax=Streptomyces sp. SAS_269 TaxID=3412749 RepID=UPI00403CC0F4
MFLPQQPPGGAPSGPVPFAFLAEADRFRSNVTPPPRERASLGELAGRWLLGLTLVAGLVGALVPGPRSTDAADRPRPTAKGPDRVY